MKRRKNIRKILGEFFKKLANIKKRPLILPKFLRQCVSSKDIDSQIFAHNFFREVIFKNIPEPKLLSIAKDLDDYIEKRPSTVPPVGRAEGFPYNFRSSLLKGRSPRINKNKALSHIISENDFWSRYLNKSIHALPKDKERYFFRLTTKGLDDTMKGKKVGNRLDLLWVTLSKEIERLRARHLTGKPVEDIVRDNLGLFFLGKDEKILEIKFPPSFLSNLHVPTTFDAELKCKYFQPQKEKDGWGRTIHCRKLSISLPETTHPLHCLPVSSDCYNRMGKLNSDVVSLKLKAWQTFLKKSQKRLANDC